MQLLGTWLVAFQAIRLDGGRCFKGVHLSPLGFAACQSKKCTNRAKSIFSHRFHSKFAEECDAVA